MEHDDLEAARRLHRSLREIVFFQFGGWKDEESLHDFEYLCDRAAEQVDDEACRRKLELVRRYAAELFSDEAHRKWDCGSMAGSDVLRLEIVELLDAFRARLVVIEAARGAASLARDRGCLPRDLAENDRREKPVARAVAPHVPA